MKTRFQNVPIRCWRNLSTGIEVRNPSISLSGTDEPAEILMEALSETINAPTPSQRKVTLLGSEPQDYKSFHFRKVHEDHEIKELWIGLEGDQPVLEFTERGAKEAKRVFDLWIDGFEDFQISPNGKAQNLGAKEKNSGELWFWISMLP